MFSNSEKKEDFVQKLRLDEQQESGEISTGLFYFSNFRTYPSLTLIWIQRNNVSVNLVQEMNGTLTCQRKFGAADLTTFQGTVSSPYPLYSSVSDHSLHMILSHAD